MARRKAEIDLLGVASKEELVKFEVGKQDDLTLAETVSKINKNTNKNLVTEEELLRIKKKGEQEILDIQNELKEFKISEERKMSYLPIEEEHEEEEEYIPTRLEKVLEILKTPFVKLVDFFDDLTGAQKIRLLKSVGILFILCITMTLAVFAAKKYNISSKDEIHLKLQNEGTAQVAAPLTDVTLNGDNFVLTRIAIDGLNTIFIFEGMTEFTDNFTASMVDSDGNEYQMDQHYMRNLREDISGRTLAMEPLNDGIREFDLLLKDERSGDVFKYSFILDKFLEKPNYINMYNTKNVNRSGLNVDSYTASASGSNLNFSLTSTGLDYTYRIIDRPGMSISLYEDLSILPSKQNQVEQYDFTEDKISLFQENYSLPKNLTSTLNFKIDNIFKSFDSGKVITSEQAKAGMKLDYGQYTLYIEGIQKRGDMAVLVYHCVDNKFVPPVTETEKTDKNKEIEKVNTFEVKKTQLNETSAVYTYVDFEIVLKNYKGEAVDYVSPSKLNIGDEGADVVFVDDRLAKVANNYSIRINSVNIRDAVYETAINLSDNARLNQREQSQYGANVEKIENAFIGRLGYKSAEIPKNSIEHFSKAVMDDRALMQRYTPMKLDSPATYSAKVIASKERDKQIYAVVEEDFIYTVDGKVYHENYDHAVIYDISSYEIISDEVIKTNEVK